MRPLFAFLVSPVPAVVLLLLVGVRLIGNRDPVPAAVFLYCLLFVLQLVFAVPPRWLFTRRKWQSLWIDAALGGLAGMLPIIGYLVLWPSSERLAILFGVVVVFTVIGAMTGLTYGLLRLRDRRAKQAITPTDLADRFS
jgi:hypothetical protein